MHFIIKEMFSTVLVGGYNICLSYKLMFVVI